MNERLPEGSLEQLTYLVEDETAPHGFRFQNLRDIPICNFRTYDPDQMAREVAEDHEGAAANHITSSSPTSLSYKSR